MTFRLEYVVRGVQYTMTYNDRKGAIGNACQMMKNREVSALQLLDWDGFPMMTYRKEDERETSPFDT